MNSFNNGNNGNDNLGNLLDLISILLGWQNLIENRQQSAYNDVQKANKVQERHMLDDLHAQFDEQNEILKYQNSLLEQILTILKGDKKDEL